MSYELRSSALASVLPQDYHLPRLHVVIRLVIDRRLIAVCARRA